MSLIETYTPWSSQPPMDTPAGPGVHAVLHPLPGQVDLVTRLRTVYANANPQSRYVVGRAGFGRFVATSNARSLYPVCAFTAGSPLMLLSVFHTSNPASQNDNVRIGNAPSSFRLLEITTNTSGQVLASARGSDAVVRTVTGPAITGEQVVAAVATYEPGAGVSLAVDGVDYGTTAFSQNLSHVPTVISDSLSTNCIAYLSAWLDADVWRGRQVELTQNPWVIFAPRRVWVPVSASGGGGGDATAPGVTQSAQASLLAAAAAAASAAAGATVTAAASLLAGAAQAASAAAGITSTTTATLLPGLASGTGDASAPGAVLAFGAALQAGLPNAGAAAAGRTLALTSSLIAGAAGGAAGAMAPGALLQLQASLLAGGVAVDAVAMGTLLSVAAQLQAGSAEGDTAELPILPSAPPRLPRLQAATRAPRTQPRSR